jgi:hypothetical protein
MRIMAKTKALGEKPVPVPLFFTTNPTWTGLESNLGFCGKNYNIDSPSEHNTPDGESIL